MAHVPLSPPTETTRVRFQVLTGEQSMAWRNGSIYTMLGGFSFSDNGSWGVFLVDFMTHSESNSFAIRLSTKNKLNANVAFFFFKGKNE